MVIGPALIGKCLILVKFLGANGAYYSDKVVKIIDFNSDGQAIYQVYKYFPLDSGNMVPWESIDYDRLREVDEGLYLGGTKVKLTECNAIKFQRKKGE